MHLTWKNYLQKIDTLRSDYKKYIDEYQKIISFFEVLSDSGMLGNFCDVNGVEEKEIVQAIDYYNNAETYVEDHNEEFLAKSNGRGKRIYG